MIKSDQENCDRYHRDKEDKVCSDYERALSGIQLEIPFPTYGTSPLLALAEACFNSLLASEFMSKIPRPKPNFKSGVANFSFATTNKSIDIPHIKPNGYLGIIDLAFEKLANPNDFEKNIYNAFGVPGHDSLKHKPIINFITSEYQIKLDNFNRFISKLLAINNPAG